MKREIVWSNRKTGLWDVTDPNDILLISFGLWVSVLRLDDSKVTLHGLLPKTGPYLHSLDKGHSFHITWSECGPPYDYYGNEQVIVSLTDCEVLNWWVEDFVNMANPESERAVCLIVELSCNVEFFFGGEGEHVKGDYAR